MPLASHVTTREASEEVVLPPQRPWPKNFLFVGNDAADRNFAGLYSLVATCEANGINPRDYLADVLLRVQYNPTSRIDELLPGPWSRRLVADTS